jgi:hypothetical protein
MSRRAKSTGNADNEKNATDQEIITQKENPPTGKPGNGDHVSAPPAAETPPAADGASTGSMSSAVRLVVSVVAFATLGVAIGLGVSLLRDSAPAPESAPGLVGAPVPVDSKVGDNKDLQFDDDLKTWNLRAAPYISPLINQLARAKRETLGGQIALCREQSTTLTPVLELPAPPDRAVAAEFDAWRKAVDKALQNCIDVVPGGDDARDIKRLMQELSDTEPLFARFLEAQRPRVNVDFNANPEMYDPVIG